MNSTNVLTKFSHRVAVYIPGTNGLDTLASDGQVADGLNYVVGNVTKAFGASTVIDGFGTYEADNGTIVREPVKIVYAFCNDVNDETVEQVFGWALFVKEYFLQECVAVEIDNELFLVG